ncbi:MAG TPA: enoyl-CoA hydratase/isomerase family protein [Rhizobiaceae bacterium]|nr:enoyl-CoA hydratase/isomerase family protein [Rhizobiaceae bacterium]
MDFGGGEEIRFERIGKAGVVTLTRPKALNALTHGMVKALALALDAWETDPAVTLVVVKGEGRAFCAGGDILAVYEAGRAGRPSPDFFADEYRLNARIRRFEKPYVSLIDGIVMGGGVGISCHGSHRVMTENALFAMPEVGIGFFPDVGGSYILPRLKGSFGMYLALTGNRIRYGDALSVCLATHAVPSAALGELFSELCEAGDVDGALRKHGVTPGGETDEATLHSIQRHFSQSDLEAVLTSLRNSHSGDAFSAATMETLLKRSPTSLSVAFLQITTGAMLDMDECMRMEFRILNRMLAGHDFYEGIRATLVEKGTKPEWKPATLDAVDRAAIDAYFAPLPDGELEL